MILARNAIDPFVYYDTAGSYYLFYKNETTKVIEYATGATLDSFTHVGTVNGSWPAEFEGLSITKLPNGTYRLYADHYTGGTQYFVNGQYQITNLGRASCSQYLSSPACSAGNGVALAAGGVPRKLGCLLSASAFHQIAVPAICGGLDS